MIAHRPAAARRTLARPIVREDRCTRPAVPMPTRTSTLARASDVPRARRRPRVRTVHDRARERPPRRGRTVGDLAVRISRHALPHAERVRIVARAVAVDAAGNRRGAERAATLRR